MAQVTTFGNKAELFVIDGDDNCIATVWMHPLYGRTIVQDHTRKGENISFLRVMDKDANVIKDASFSEFICWMLRD